MSSHERLSDDDLATRREEEFRALALRQAAEAGAVRATPGSCANCGEACLPQAVYCDADCRADHERRLRVQGRLSGGSQSARLPGRAG